VRHHLLTEEVLEDTRAVLADRGVHGVEGVVLWVGRRSGEDVQILFAFGPPQIAYKSPDGLAVSIPDEAVTEIIAALPPDLFIPVRVHSHPTDAYHSATDNTNMLLSHRGAISIVVPYFADRPIELTQCSVNELDNSFCWREMPVGEIQERFIVHGR